MEAETFLEQLKRHRFFANQIVHVEELSERSPVALGDALAVRARKLHKRREKDKSGDAIRPSG